MTAGQFNTDSPRRQYGFTLVELMITLAVAAILLGMAAPSFTNMIKNNRLTTQANDLISSINYARSEAIRRGATTKLETNNGLTDWSAGWTVKDNAGNTLRHQAAFDGTTTLVGSSEALSYRSNGFLADAAPLTFTLCDDRSGETGRTIQVALTGRTTVSHSACD